MSTTQHTDRDDRAGHVKQYLLAGQVAAPAGPVDTKMMYVMHHAFRRDLALFAEAAAATPVEDRDTWRALHTRWGIFSGSLHHHHAGEDAGLWPLLLERAGAGEQETLTAMEAEHALIDPLLAACAAGMAAMAGADGRVPDATVATRLHAGLVATRECLAQHLAHEETEAMAMVQAHLTTEEWEEMAKEHFGKGQTLRQLAAVIPWTLDRLPADVTAALFADAPAVMKLLWRATRGRFERLDARTRRHLA